jgi:hypothetical protein
MQLIKVCRLFRYVSYSGMYVNGQQSNGADSTEKPVLVWFNQRGTGSTTGKKYMNCPSFIVPFNGYLRDLKLEAWSHDKIVAFRRACKNQVGNSLQNWCWDSKYKKRPIIRRAQLERMSYSTFQRSCLDNQAKSPSQTGVIQCKPRNSRWNDLWWLGVQTYAGKLYRFIAAT